MRMPFGINSAPEVWQRTMNQLVEGLNDTEVIHDDFLIVGCGDTDDEAEADHDRNLKALLERARERNLCLNADKLKLKMTQVPYIGHLRTREGLRVDRKKVEAIEEMPAPKDAKVVQRLLGSVNYFRSPCSICQTSCSPSDDSSIMTLSGVGCIPTNRHPMT